MRPFLTNRLGATVALTLLLFAPIYAHAEERVSHEGEVRVRIASRAGGAERLYGHVIQVGSDSLLILSRSGVIAPLAWKDISGVERYSGRGGHAALGAGIGFLAGALIATFHATDLAEDRNGVLTDKGVAFLLPMAGAGFGALIGELCFRGEKWKPVPIESVRRNVPVQ